MPVRHLPSNPNLDHLRYQAKDLLKEHSFGTPGVVQRIREFHPRFSEWTDAEIMQATVSLSEAQLTIAREHGFPSWTRLKRHIEKPASPDQLKLPLHERIEDVNFRRAVDLIDTGDVSGLRIYLAQHPKLVHQQIVFEGRNYFRTPTLLEFVAENPIRHGTLLPSIVDVTRVILEAGAELAARNETLLLVATGCVTRECGAQLPLIDLLCAYGADPQAALQAAAFHGELEALNALIGHGARVDLPIAAALGRIEEFNRLLSKAGKKDRHLALAMSSQYGHIEIVRSLLDAGEDPSRYNPVGGHSHSTPLHQAALGGYDELVRLLVERGARVDLKDLLWDGTPADWAEHAGRTELEGYLRLHEAKRK